METIVLDGVDFVKASVAAKQFNYTSDYVGQLCRAKKVDARLVGRTWFVNPDSLINHKKDKFTTILEVSDQDESSDRAIYSKSSRLTIEPVVRNKTIKSLPEVLDGKHNTSGQKMLKVSYEQDEESLLPTIVRKVLPPPKTLKIEPAGAKKIRIVSYKKSHTSFAAEELPDFALSGKLSVQGLQEAEKEVVQDEVESSEDSPAVSENIHKNSPKPIVKTKKLKVLETAGARKAKVEMKPSKFPLHSNNLVRSEARRPNSVPTNQALTVSSVNEVRFSPTSVSEVQPVKINFAVMMSPVIAIFIALAVVTTIFSASSDVTVSKTSYQSGVVLQVANLFEFIQQQFR